MSSPPVLIQTSPISSKTAKAALSSSRAARRLRYPQSPADGPVETPARAARGSGGRLLDACHEGCFHAAAGPLVAHQHPDSPAAAALTSGVRGQPFASKHSELSASMRQRSRSRPRTSQVNQVLSSHRRRGSSSIPSLTANSAPLARPPRSAWQPVWAVRRRNWLDKSFCREPSRGRTGWYRFGALRTRLC